MSRRDLSRHGYRICFSCERMSKLASLLFRPRSVFYPLKVRQLTSHSQLTNQPLASLLPLLDAAEADAFTSIDHSKSAALSAFEESRASSQNDDNQPTPDPGDDVLMQDARRGELRASLKDPRLKDTSSSAILPPSHNSRFRSSAHLSS